MDFFGEPEYLNKGIGILTLKTFLENFIDKEFSDILVDPDSKNIAAIKTYEKVGFKIIGGNEKILMNKANNKNTNKISIFNWIQWTSHRMTGGE
ncbi:MAG TPA: acetyltransferase [Rickettsia endosymbiont of Degeeriella rufa]|nr:acetyltransferase [Rickettsia endosymbiont of Degeeriella rufa]